VAKNWTGLLIRGPKGALKPLLANAVTILTRDEAWKDVISFNEFTNEVVTRKVPAWCPDDRVKGQKPGSWTDDDTRRLKAWFERRYELCIPTNVVEEAISLVAHKHIIHPVRDWLDSLKWDRKPRLDKWLVKHGGADDTPYTRAVASMFLISACARVYKPGCKVDHTLVLEGKQGIGKSSLLRGLVGDEWFMETNVELGSKDSYIMLHGKWVVEMAELDSLSKADLGRIKAYLTAQVDRYRAVFARRAKDAPRQVVFTGTVNFDEYLKDESGGRRFWPVRLAKVDLGPLRREREQIWAEAVYRFKHGERWHVTDDSLLGMFEAEQEQRRQIDPWEPVLKRWLYSKALYAERGVMTSDALNALGIEAYKRTRYEEQRVGAVLRKLGWDRVRVRLTGGRSYIYKPLFRAVNFALREEEPEETTKVRKKGPKLALVSPKSSIEFSGATE
jgi:putative DNA primase/helicase